MTDLLQMKVTGEVQPIPSQPGNVTKDQRSLINSVTDYWFGAKEESGWNRN